MSAFELTGKIKRRSAS